MSRLYTEALSAVKTKLNVNDPTSGSKLFMATNSGALRYPDDKNNLFYATINWPSDGDPNSNVGLRANFPGERLKNRQGYLGVTFNREDRGEVGLVSTKLKIIYGLGTIGLLEPKTALLAEEPVELSDVREGEPLWTPATPQQAAGILLKFGIVEK